MGSLLNLLNNLNQFAEDIQTEIYTTDYTYDRDNHVTEIAYDGSTHKVNYTYDELGRVATRVAECSADAGKLTSTYEYVNGGYGTNSTTPLVKKIAQNGISFEYTYATRGNIISEKRGDLTTTYVYDALGQLIRVNDPHENATWVYNYDRGGNITSKVKYAYTTGTLGSAQQTIPYVYGDSNWKDKLTSYNGQTIAYDAIGNPTNDGTWTYEWQAGRQLKRMSKADMSVEFKYDHNGMRTQKIVTESGVSIITNYTILGKLIAHMSTGNNELHFFYDTQSCLTKVRFNGTTYTYVHNLQGDILGILDNSGNLVVEYTYDVWGNPMPTNGILANTLGKLNPFRYRGYAYDEETELYYLKKRYYALGMCRFLNIDEGINVKQIVGTNLNAYCVNSPILFSDRTGMSAQISPQPSRPQNWNHYEKEYWASVSYHEKLMRARQVWKNLKDTMLARKAKKLAEHGGGIINFKSGVKATCYTTESCKQLPSSNWTRYTIDVGIAVVGEIKCLEPIAPYASLLGFAMLGIDCCSNLQTDMINRCINTPSSIGWIRWEFPRDPTLMPTAWTEDYFTPDEWVGEIERIQFFD